MNITEALRNLKKFQHDGNKKVSAKNKCTEELCLMTLTSDPNFDEKLTFCLKNDMKNLVNVNASSGKFENLLFDELILSKESNV